MRCDKCRKRGCRMSANHWRQLFFSFGRGEQPVCHEFEPNFYRGLEGVYP